MRDLRRYHKFLIIILILVLSVVLAHIITKSRAASPQPLSKFPGLPATFIVSNDIETGDFTDVQSAINALPLNGGKIFVRAGVYNLSQPLVFKSKLTLEGEGNSTVLQCAADPSVACVKPVTPGTSQVLLHDFKLLQANAAAQGIGLDMSDVSNAYVRNVRVENFGTCLQMFDRNDRTFYSTYRDMQLFDCKNGISVGGSQANLNLFENMRIRPKTNSGGIGVSLVDARGLTFINLNVESPANGGVGITGIRVDATSREIVFTNPWIEHNQVGVSIHSGAKRITFVGGSITSNTTDLIDNSPTTTMLNVSKTGTLVNYQPPQTR